MYVIVIIYNEYWNLNKYYYYIDNLFDTNELLTLLSSSLITLSSSLDCIVYTQQINIVSSAYIKIGQD